MTILFDTKSQLQQDFEEFDRENPKMWELFKKFAFRAIRKGFKHYGAKTIFEAIRYHCNIVTSDPDFKLNNNYTAYYARKFHRTFPEYDGFFETRRIR